MAATVDLLECNSAGQTTTSAISNINFGSTDAANLVYTSFPITVGTNSYDKYIKVRVSAWDVSNKIDNLQIWKSAGNYVAGERIVTNLTASGYSSVSYATPALTSYSGTLMPTAAPGTANLGVGASGLTGYMSGSVTTSDFWRMQLQTNVGGTTPVGNANQKTFTIQYDEQ